MEFIICSPDDLTVTYVLNNNNYPDDTDTIVISPDPNTHNRKEKKHLPKFLK